MSLLALRAIFSDLTDGQSLAQLELVQNYLGSCSAKAAPDGSFDRATTGFATGRHFDFAGDHRSLLLTTSS
jgi:hypothetical protein